MNGSELTRVEKEQELHFFRHSGCLIRSELALPEWSGFAVSAGAPDIAIRFDHAIAEGAPPDHYPVVADGALRFSSPDIGTWCIRGGSEITVHPFADRDAPEVRLFTLGSAWGTLGYQRGWAMLHGSAVLGPKGAVLFCGPQGAGKSTMGAAMVQAGLPLVSDDLSRVDPAAKGGATMLYPSSTRVKLWQEAIDRLELGERAKVRDFFRDDKFHLDADLVADVHTPVPLAGIYTLEFGDSVGIERLKGAQAATSVLKETIYRKRFLQAMGRLTEQAVFAAQIAASVPVYRLSRPRDLAQLDAVCNAVQRHISGSGQG